MEPGLRCSTLFLLELTSCHQGGQALDPDHYHHMFSQTRLDAQLVLPNQLVPIQVIGPHHIFGR